MRGGTAFRKARGSRITLHEASRLPSVHSSPCGLPHPKHPVRTPCLPCHPVLPRRLSRAAMQAPICSFTRATRVWRGDRRQLKASASDHVWVVVGAAEAVSRAPNQFPMPSPSATRVLTSCVQAHDVVVQQTCLLRSGYGRSNLDQLEAHQRMNEEGDQDIQRMVRVGAANASVCGVLLGLPILPCWSPFCAVLVLVHAAHTRTHTNTHAYTQGRSGKWFSYQHFELEPDIVTLAKGVTSGYAPLSCTVTTQV